MSIASLTMWLICFSFLMLEKWHLAQGFKKTSNDKFPSVLEYQSKMRKYSLENIFVLALDLKMERDTVKCKK